jgi:hypothetical protein
MVAVNALIKWHPLSGANFNKEVAAPINGGAYPEPFPTKWRPLPRTVSNKMAAATQNRFQ